MQPIPVVKKESPVKRFPGAVELPAYLTAVDMLAWRAVVQEYDRLVAELKDSHVTIDSALSLRAVWNDGICKIVRRWTIEGLPEYLEAEQFPVAPRKAASALRNWLMGEINELYFTEEEIPNG
jgi:hypothetical protein